MRIPLRSRLPGSTGRGRFLGGLARCVALTIFATILPATASLSANLLPNPGFDEDLSDWSFGTNVRWSSKDVHDAGDSGSLALQVTDPGAGPVGAWTCVPVTGGAYYDVGATERMRVDSGADGYSSVSFGFYLDDHCTSPADWGVSISTGLRDEWTHLSTKIQAPENAASAELLLFAWKPFGGAEEARVRTNFDDAHVLEIEPAPGCADPVAPFYQTTASDALFILKASVQTMPCPLCVCDVNGSASVTVTDALGVLRFAVSGGIFGFLCQGCPA